LSVSRNGREVPLASLGVAIPVDPGTQHVSASAPSHRAWTGRVEVADGATSIHLLIPSLRPLPRQVEAAPRAKPQTIARTSPSAQRAWGIAASTVGVAGLLSGAGLGLWARYDYHRSRLDHYCPSSDHNGCTSDGLALRQKAQGLANASTVAFLAGGALLATGIVLWSTAPNGAREQSSTTAQLRATVTPGSIGSTLEGVW
jgi:hypothetical protein